ncbi:HAD family hydrolase [Nitrosopumilus sp. b2]|uniref:D-glycero-alpha-D-manno-heptose-1,7-bisphosphate 7-phosphatase n=1 Tax=Nitrosopumilus sp. b2 TaxID=2109908 RepID=UPI0015F5CEE3|nr:HAD family hydrolase [Nitrosopumilus sp. b2]KAF6245790.1 HAD family hydrolase [Nitrosopumilus sp. b2]
MNKAVFLDRDGVINKEKKTYVKTIDDLEIFDNISSCIQKLKKNNFLVIVITNQSAIGRGLIDVEKLNEIHEEIQNHLAKSNTKIDAFYFCPHHPDENCLCRKPQPELIIKASNDYDIDLQSSWIIGDNDSDVLAGHNAGCKGIKTDNSNLPSAIEKILKN